MLISILIVFMQTLDSEIDHFKFEYTLYSHYVCNYYLVTFEFPSHHFFLDRAAGSFYHVSLHVVTSFLVVLWTDARLWLSWRSHKFNAIAIVFAFCYLLECLFL